eukprot:6211824-Pleurochrysis_carterae.AAC.2
MEMNGFCEVHPDFAIAYFVPFKDRNVAREMGAVWDQHDRSRVARSVRIANLLNTRFARSDSEKGRAARAADKKHRKTIKLDTKYYVKLPRETNREFATFCGIKYDNWRLPFVADCEALATVEAKGWQVVAKDSNEWHDYAMRHSSTYNHSYTQWRHNFKF